MSCCEWQNSYEKTINWHQKAAKLAKFGFCLPYRLTFVVENLVMSIFGKNGQKMMAERVSECVAKIRVYVGITATASSSCPHRWG